MRACESLTTNGSSMIILKTEEMFHLSRSIKNINNHKKLKLNCMSSTLRDLAGCLLKALHNVPSCIQMDRLHRSICCALISPVTMQHQSTVLWQETLPGTHYHSIRYAAGYFSQDWTNRYWLFCDKSFMRREKCSFVFNHMILYARLWRPGSCLS